MAGVKTSEVLAGAANFAAAVTLCFAAYQFWVNTRAQQIQNSLVVLNDGRQLEQQYQTGKAEARDIVAFYYRVYVSRKVLENEIIAPLERSLCSSVIEDPRIGEYWGQVKKSREDRYFIAGFVEKMNDIGSKKLSCD